MGLATVFRLGLLLLLLPGGWTAVSTGTAHGASLPTKLRACYGYSCRFSASFAITTSIAGRFGAIMASGRKSAESERAAISKAVQYYEELSTKAIGARDQARSPVVASGAKGQMDCIDESTNTRGLLLYLAQRGLMKFHKVRDNTARGFFVDGRYPHFTAVVRDSSGKDWAVDSWFEAAGGPPDIVPLSYWRTRGVMGER